MRSLVLVAALLAAPAVARAAEPDRIERAADKVLDGRYQKYEDGWDPVSGRSGKVRPRAERSGPADGSSGGIRERRVAGPGAGLGMILTWLLWGGIAVAAALVVLMIIKELARGRDRKEVGGGGGGAEEGAVDADAALDRPLDDADRLAHEGRFAEAIHVLLLRTFQELARAASVRFTSSWTSREILARIPVRPGAQEALAELVRVVELTWFGDAVPGEAEWLRCRAQFDHFVTAYHGARRAA